jgi:hypothetical protein
MSTQPSLASQFYSEVLNRYFAMHPELAPTVAIELLQDYLHLEAENVALRAKLHDRTSSLQLFPRSNLQSR